MKTSRVKNRKLLSNIIIVFLIIALPLFVWAVVNERFDLRDRASSDEPSICVPIDNVITVTPSGPEGTCHNIQTAVDAADGDGYTIKIEPGEHYMTESVIVNSKSNITIIGTPELGVNATTINFSNNSWGFLFQNSSGSIGWLNIQGGSANGMLSINDSNNFSVGYVNIYSQTSHTMDIHRSDNISVYNTEIQSSAGALEVSNSNGVIISNNRIHNSNNAILIHNSSARIHSNLIYENREKGIVLNKPISVEIYSNTIADNNGAGLEIMFVEPIYETIVNVYKNIFARNGYGVYSDSTFASIDSFSFNFNDVWGNGVNYVGIPNQTSLRGNISFDPVFGVGYCVDNESPVLYGLISNGEYMGSRLYCDPIPISLLITTDSFIEGRVGEDYRNFFYGEATNYSTDPQLTLSVNNAPPGLSVPSELCGTSYPTDRPTSTKRVECALDGIPTVAGNYVVNVILTDNFNNSVSKDVPISILSITPSPSPSPSPVYKVGDVNGDDRVNLIDIGIIIDYFDSTNPANPRADVNSSGRVDLIDIGIIIDRYEW